ncbi:MAG: hypothetical protein HYY93_02775 [Planctomycetes bacterium]|nr:hypothetical protein [Planctomycetota bacterium]
MEGVELLPNEGDPDASYTYEAYDLGDLKKLSDKRSRERTVSNALDAIRDTSEYIRKLQERARHQPPEQAKLSLTCAAKLERLRNMILDQVRRYQPVPIDAPTACRCGPMAFRLPEYLEQQCLDIALDSSAPSA